MSKKNQTNNQIQEKENEDEETTLFGCSPIGKGWSFLDAKSNSIAKQKEDEVCVHPRENNGDYDDDDDCFQLGSESENDEEEQEDVEVDFVEEEEDQEQDRFIQLRVKNESNGESWTATVLWSNCVKAVAKYLYGYSLFDDQSQVVEPETKTAT